MSGLLSTLPDPRRPKPRSVPVLRWGVLGTGWIAERFVASLHGFTEQRVVAVGSRRRASGQAFADAHGISTVHASAAELAGDPGVDVVYVATPHPAHRDGAMAAIAAGKHVLVEKPLGICAAEAEGILAAAESAGVTCIEAMWTIFLPRLDVVRQVLEQGLLGDVRTVVADHGERFAASHRIHDPAAAGGALLDLGIYCTALSTWVLGPAEEVSASGEATERGVVGQAGIVSRHAGGARSVLHTTVLTQTPTSAVIAGTAGTLTLPGPFFMPGDVVLTSTDGRRANRWIDPAPLGHAALYHSAIELAVRVGAGELTTPLRPAEEVRSSVAILDATLEQLGLDYSGVRLDTSPDDSRPMERI